MTLSPATQSQTAGGFLLSQFCQAPPISALVGRYFTHASQTVEATLDNLANPSVKALLMAALVKQVKRPVIVVCPDPQVAVRYRYDLLRFLSEKQVLLYPTEAFSPYEQSVFPIQALKQQVAILNQLNQWQAGDEGFLLLVSPKNLLLKHLSLEELSAHSVSLKTGDEFPPDNLVERLLALGYVKTSLIMEAGEFSQRGDIFDLYPVNGDPVRIEFFGDTIEAIRQIDIDTQRSVAAIKTVTAIPRMGIVLSHANQERLKVAVDDCLKQQLKTLPPDTGEGLSATLNTILAGLSGSLVPDGVDYMGPLVHNASGAYKTLGEYLTEQCVLVVDDWAMLTNNLEALSDRLTREHDEGIRKGRLLDIHFSYHQSAEAVLKQLKAAVPQRLFLETYPFNADSALGPTDALIPTHLVSLPLQAPEGFKADLKKAAETFQQMRREQIQVVVTTDNPQRVLDSCKEWDLPAVYWNEDGMSADEASWLSKDVIISKSGPREGFILPEEKLAHFTDAELFGRKQKRYLTAEKRGGKREDVDVIQSIQDLRPGDYVVHEKHGIGQFAELCRMDIGGQQREYLSIQYASNDRLYLPVDQVNQLTRYRGAGEAPPKLNKMGGIEWGSVKKKVEKSIQKIAKDLVALYSKRAKAKGIPFEPDSPWQVEMEESFPFTETPDQWQAIVEMKKDMESDKPMDRLICGDVGFGKTEVAIRGLFKCVLSGKQAAVLVPTTILAQQHFNTIADRFKPYPVRVALLSRFRTAQEQKQVVNRLTLGECDIVVGTHRLLQKDVVFKDLGLLVIDEEHRFGVSHKEKIKQMRSEVDVLTLSATPIPRTLYMSLSGVRDMSLINTPPVNRAPIQTYVGPYNPAQIRMAILQELDRGGQCYFLHNRVQTIYHKLEELQALVPEARFRIGHGQMSPDQLENVMLDFAQQQFDVLLCTTIIESGLDIPSANTMIIDRSDRFGLAQLYQIRGRVGRSNIQAYAYCYYDPEKTLTEDAKNRLRAIREFTTLGSGYQIALRDLEIRGVGNILGSEQHGHMVAVGFDLYCQLLEDTIHELQGEKIERKAHSIVDINVTALIPTHWVGDDSVKMAEYKRLADVESERGLDIIVAEWQDRFGPIPAETVQLLNLARLRILCTELNIPTVREEDEHLRIAIPYTLQEWLFLQKQLPPHLGSKARWIPGVSSHHGSKPALLIKHTRMTPQEMVEYLLAFFTETRKRVNETVLNLQTKG